MNVLPEKLINPGRDIIILPSEGIKFVLFCFSPKAPHFRVEPRVAIIEMILKVARLFGIKAQGCLYFDSTILGSNERKTSKIWKIFPLEAQKLLRISDLRLKKCWAIFCDFRKIEARVV